MYEHLESFITAFIGENGMCHKMPRERIVPSEVAVYDYLKRLGISKPQESEVKALVKALSEKFSGETGAIIVGEGDEQVVYWFQIQPVQEETYATASVTEAEAYATASVTEEETYATASVTEAEAYASGLHGEAYKVMFKAMGLI